MKDSAKSEDIVRSVERLDMGPCASCGMPAYSVYGGGAIRLSGGAPICGDCVRRLRFAYPVSQMVVRKAPKRVDPLAGLKALEFLEALKGAGEKLEDLREEYGYSLAAMRVDSFSAEKQGLFKAPKVRFTGSVLFGKFNPGDRVRLLRTGTELAISEIGVNFLGGLAGEAGYPAEIYAEGKGILAEPGDVLIKPHSRAFTLQ